jgi:cyclase
MKRARIIPVLLLKNQGLYKTIKFSKERYIGDPLNAVKIFNEKQCDELVIVDILASKEKKAINFKKIKEIALECFMPLAYGGGISELEHIEKILKLGVEKVVLNSVLLEKPNFLKEAVNEFGSSTIVASVDLKKNIFGKYGVYSHAGIKNPSDMYDFLDSIEKADAGEMMINIVDLDGMQSGYDFKLADILSKRYSIPITWCGGCSGFEDMRKLIENTQVSAAAAGSFFIFKGSLQAVLISYPRPEEIASIKV